MNIPERRRIRLTIHYDGRAFHGWQIQPDQRTVQGELEVVLAKLTNGPCPVIGSGRTDRGVHATGQVAATDVPGRWTASALRRAMNALVPDDVWIADAAEAPPYFHPRYDATTRSYVYRVGLAAEADSPFRSPWCWPLVRPVDLLAMERATERILGEHSFKAFAKAGQEERGDRCTVTEARWAPWEGIGLEFHISANRFLHHMVRYLTGTLVDIGLGQRPPEVMDALLANEPGLETSSPAPPEGLFLTGVTYPADAGTKPPRRRGPQLVPQAAREMRQTIGAATFVVRDYDEAIAFFTAALGFELVEDTALGAEKRWVVVRPRGSTGPGLLLARAATPEQEARVGDQTGGRVAWFLHTDDFWRDHRAFTARGVRFVEEPREESYGTVAVFQDLYGNLWDLLQPRREPT